MRRNPLRYAGWHALDFMMGPGAVFLIILVLVGIGAWKAGVTPAGGEGLLRTVIAQAALPFTLLAAARVVSGDRSRGYFRSYFNRPVSPVMHYGLRWVLGGIAVVLFVPLAAAAIAITSGTFTLDTSLLVSMALLVLLLGGLTFLISTVSRFDWAAAFVILVVQSVMHQLRQGGSLDSGFFRGLYTILPPFHLVNPGNAPPEGGALWHVLIYGGALVLAALAVLRWRPIGEGGRE